MTTMERVKNFNLSFLWDKVRLDGYSDENQGSKTTAHSLAKSALRKLAKKLGLQKGQFNISSNMAGIAISGEVTLMTEHLPDCQYGVYVQVGQSCLGPGHSIMWRTTKHIKDYTGGINQWGSVTDYLSTDAGMDDFASKIRNSCRG